MSRMAGKRREFQEYLKSFDRKARGAGSQKDPKVDRFSAMDVRDVFDEGLARGLSREEAARGVLDYADDIRGETKMGGGTRKALARLAGYLESDDDQREAPQSSSDRTFEGAFSNYPYDIPEGVNQFGDPNRPGAFAGSYFDYLGIGDPSDPRNFYMQGLEGPVGIARADGPVRRERYGVPDTVPSFLSDGPLPSTYETESEYQDENRPDLGDIFTDAAKGAGGAFLDSVLKGILEGALDSIRD